MENVNCTSRFLLDQLTVKKLRYILNDWVSAWRLFWFVYNQNVFIPLAIKSEQKWFRNTGCFPLCLTIRSKTSGTNQRKMERHFSSKVNFQPDRSVPFTFRLKFRLLHSEMGLETRIFVNGTVRFGRTGPTGLWSNIPVGPNRKRPFHLTSAWNFGKFWLNGKHPLRAKRFGPLSGRDDENTGQPRTQALSLLLHCHRESFLPFFLPSFLWREDKRERAWVWDWNNVIRHVENSLGLSGRHSGLNDLGTNKMAVWRIQLDIRFLFLCLGHIIGSSFILWSRTTAKQLNQKKETLNGNE